MVSNFAAVYAALAILFGALIVPREAFIGFRGRAIAIWLMVLPILVLSEDPLATLLLLMLALVCLAPINPTHRLAFFVAVIPACPVYLTADLPFPGLNHLIAISYYKVAIVALLLPPLFLPRLVETPRQSWTAIDFCVIAYLVYTTFQIGLNLGLIGGLRFLLDQMMIVAVPYFAITRLATDSEQISNSLKAFLVAAGMLAAISLVSTYKQWDFYRFAQFDAIAAANDYRGSWLRIQATLNTHSLGFHLSACVIILEYLKHKLSISWIRLWALRATLVAGMFFTGSRGSMLALIIAFSVHILLSIRSSAFRWALIIPLAVFGSIAAYMVAYQDVSEYSLYGGFSYRQQLLSTSIEYISDHLIFGDLNFLSSGRFNHLIQGQGIIDITNLYLLIGLNHGMIGLLLFFAPMIYTAVRLAGLAVQYSKNKDRSSDLPVSMHSVLCGATVAWLVLVVTTSDVGLTLHLGVFLLAIGHALAQYSTGALVQPKKSIDAASEPAPAAGSASGSPTTG